MTSRRKNYEDLARFDNSEVMREFVKIAYDSGLAELKESDVPTYSVKDGRNGSDSVKDIAEKYSEKATPDQDKDGEDLIEKAHKEKAEAINSYLKDGGRVEDLNEQHKIMVDVATKGPSINDFYHRNISAIKNVLDELVVIGHEMDAREENDIVVFADEIIAGITTTAEAVEEDLKKKLNKQAFQAAPKATEAASGFLSKFFKFVKLTVPIAALGIGSYFFLSHMSKNKSSSVLSSSEDNVGTIDRFIKTASQYITDNNGKVSKTELDDLTQIVQTVKRFKDEYVGVYRKFGEEHRAILNALNYSGNFDPQNVEKLFSNLKQADTNISKTIEKFRTQLEANAQQLSLSADTADSRFISSDQEYSRMTQSAKALDALFDMTYSPMEKILVEAYTDFMGSLAKDSEIRTRTIQIVQSKIDAYKQRPAYEDTNKPKE